MGVSPHLFQVITSVCCRRLPTLTSAWFQDDGIDPLFLHIFPLAARIFQREKARRINIPIPPSLLHYIIRSHERQRPPALPCVDSPPAISMATARCMGFRRWGTYFVDDCRIANFGALNRALFYICRLLPCIAKRLSHQQRVPRSCRQVVGSTKPSSVADDPSSCFARYGFAHRLYRKNLHGELPAGRRAVGGVLMTNQHRFITRRGILVVSAVMYNSG